MEVYKDLIPSPLLEEEEPVPPKAADENFGRRIYYTSYQDQGDLELMEDRHQIAFGDIVETSDYALEFSWAYFAIFDGHGGPEAAAHAERRLLDLILSNKYFNSDDDNLVLQAIKEGYAKLQKEMKFEWANHWPKSESGLPSVSGTTASVVLIKNGKLYICQVGDSAIVLGYQDDPSAKDWKARNLTEKHMPDCSLILELEWIEQLGDWVKVDKHARTNLDIEPIPNPVKCLGVFGSYSSLHEGCTKVVNLDLNKHRCFILGTKGLWNVLPAEKVVSLVHSIELNNNRRRQIEKQEGGKCDDLFHLSERLVRRAKNAYHDAQLDADNISVIVVVF